MVGPRNFPRYKPVEATYRVSLVGDIALIGSSGSWLVSLVFADSGSEGCAVVVTPTFLGMGAMTTYPSRNSWLMLTGSTL